MEWLGDWLKQVILIILLAAFVDLLLPSQAMQRYVKTVVSLFLLLTLLTPVFELFQRDWSADRLIAEAEQMQSRGGRADPGKEKLATLESIMADSEKMKAKNTEEAKRLAEVRLSEEMKNGLVKATGAQVGEVQARINVDSKGNPVIGTVRVTLLHRKEPLQAAETGGSAQSRIQVRMEEVKPVTVHIEAASTPGSAKGGVKEASASAENPQMTEWKDEAVRYFQREWQVQEEQIDLVSVPVKQ